jgi:hypothetical protein
LGVNSRFTKVLASHRNSFAFFSAVIARDRRVDAPAKINAPMPKIRAGGLMLPAESSTFTKVLAV